MNIDPSEQPTQLTDDPRIGAEVIMTDESRRRGCEVRGTIQKINRYPSNGDEDWEVRVGNSTCEASSKQFQFVV